MHLSSKSSLASNPQKLHTQGAPWQAATASGYVSLNPVPTTSIWPPLGLVAEDMLHGQPLTTLPVPLRPLQHCFGYLCFGVFLNAIKKPSLVFQRRQQGQSNFFSSAISFWHDETGTSPSFGI